VEKKGGGRYVLIVSEDNIVRCILSSLRKGKIGPFCSIVRMILIRKRTALLE
jgi:hypothetical protein